MEFMCDILSAVPPNQNFDAAHDTHPDITISHDEVIDIFAFSSARRLNFIAYFMVFYISPHKGSPEAKSWSRYWTIRVVYVQYITTLYTYSKNKQQLKSQTYKRIEFIEI